jgi:hypothetical protein
MLNLAAVRYSIKFVHAASSINILCRGLATLAGIDRRSHHPNRVVIAAAHSNGLRVDERGAFRDLRAQGAIVASCHPFHSRSISSRSRFSTSRRNDIIDGLVERLERLAGDRLPVGQPCLRKPPRRSTMSLRRLLPPQRARHGQQNVAVQPSRQHPRVIRTSRHFALCYIREFLFSTGEASLFVGRKAYPEMH